MDKKGAADKRGVKSGDKYEVPFGGNDRGAGSGRNIEWGNVNDIEIAPELVEDVAGCSALADRGCDSDAFRQTLRLNNNAPVIPGRKNRKKGVEYDQKKYKKRGVIERIFGKIKENRRLTVRYEKSDMNFLGFILVALLKILLC